MRRVVSGAGGEYFGKEYVYDRETAGPWAIVETTVFDSLGRARERASFGRFTRMPFGAWRPFYVRHELFLDGSADGRRVRTTMRVQRASVLSSAEAADVPAIRDSPEQRWNVWQVR